jgi:ketosteroid isomerase-like protein
MDSSKYRNVASPGFGSVGRRVRVATGDVNDHFFSAHTLSEQVVTMTRHLRIGRIVLIGCACLAVPAFASWKSELKRLVDVERSFSAASQASGAKDAFLQFLAEDGTLFRPGPVPGKKWWAEHPSPAGTLVWRPVFADLSGAGDLGYTTGPFELRSNQGTRNGHYVTVWKKQADNKWKFVVDTGISHPAPDQALEEAWARPGASARKGTETPKEVSALLESDEEFSSDSSEHGTPTAFAAWTVGEARVYRDGRLPAVGRREVSSLLASSRGTLTWTPLKADVAKSGDLGYTWGRFELKTGGDAGKPQSGYYVRIWRRQADGSWKVVLDILN